MKRAFGVIVLFVLMSGAYWAWTKYQSVYTSNVELAEDMEFFIPTDATYGEVQAALERTGAIKDLDEFYWVAEKKSYPSLVKAGRYIIKDGMSNNDLVDMLRAGKQSPVKVSFNNVRTLAQLAGKVGQRLEPDSLSFLKTFTNPELIGHYGFTQENLIALFIPNTYEFYWNTDEEEFVKRMASEFKRFWSDERMAKARALKLTQSEVVTLASIVQAEQGAHPEEWPRIAGLYLNRIKRGIPLQSDPTVIFATGDFGIRRVLNKHLKQESPYNTYKHAGLPPGPIRMPDRGAVDAVLGAEDHQYIFMCAKADGSGIHNFSKTLSEHNRYAREYQRAMNNRGIFN